MRFTEFLVEAPQMGPMTPRSWADRNPNYAELDRPTVQRRAAQQNTPQQAKATTAPAPKEDPWEALKKAAVDPNAGREFITLLGAMYQAKRRNPNVVMTLPTMVTSLPASQQKLRTQLTALFNISKNDDEAHLAQRSQELQQARMNAVAQPGTNPTPGQQPAGLAKQAAPATTSGQQRDTMLQQLMAIVKSTAPKLTAQQIKQVSKELNAPLNAKRKNQKTKIPNTASGNPMG